MRSICWIFVATLLASAGFAGHPAGNRELMILRGLYFVSPPSKCDCLSPCRCPVEVQGFNPRFPRGLHWMICPGGKRG